MPLIFVTMSATYPSLNNHSLFVSALLRELVSTSKAGGPAHSPGYLSAFSLQQPPEFRMQPKGLIPLSSSWLYRLVEKRHTQGQSLAELIISPLPQVHVWVQLPPCGRTVAKSMPAARLSGGPCSDRRWRTGAVPATTCACTDSVTVNTEKQTEMF